MPQIRLQTAPSDIVLGQSLGAALLLMWGLLHLVGGAVVTVMPFNFLPFVPEQDFTHYFAHFLYGLAQLPLNWIMIQQLRRYAEARA